MHFVNLYICLLKIVGATVYFKGDFACFWGCRAYLSIYYKSTGMVMSRNGKIDGSGGLGNGSNGFGLKDFMF